MSTCIIHHDIVVCSTHAFVHHGRSPYRPVRSMYTSANGQRRCFLSISDASVCDAAVSFFLRARAVFDWKYFYYFFFFFAFNNNRYRLLTRKIRYIITTRYRNRHVRVRGAHTLLFSPCVLYIFNTI